MMPSEISAAAAPTLNIPATAKVRPWIIFIVVSPWLTLGTRSSRSNAEILMELGHVRLEVAVGDAVDDAAVLHQVVAVGDRGGEAEVLLDQQDGEAVRLQAADG